MIGGMELSEIPAVVTARYDFVKCLGRGGMGTVYLAVDKQNERALCAVKLLDGRIVQTAESRDRFRNEITASQEINHPNVAQAFDFFSAGDVLGYVMEYLEGGDLAHYMSGRALLEPQAVSLLKQIGSGLAAIHDYGIVHRDLKPENILLTREGVPKICDFGVARLQDSPQLTQTGIMVGTPKYFSPEYIEGGECDRRGDLYALGVIGFEMLAGRSPFSSVGRQDILMERFNITDETILSKLRCHPDLAKVITKAMRVRVADRYQSARELVLDLEAVGALVCSVSGAVRAPVTPSPSMDGWSRVVRSSAPVVKRSRWNWKLIATYVFLICSVSLVIFLCLSIF